MTTTRPPLDLPRLLAQPEDQYFERKSLFEGPPSDRKPRARRKVRDQVAEYVAAFANADGGVLVLGVEDDGTITGHAYNAEDIDNLLAVPERRLKPPLQRGEVVKVGEHEVILFQVDPEPQAVMVIGDGFPRRVDDKVFQESEQIINTIKQHGRMESIEEDPCAQVSMEDLDADLLRRAAEAAGMAAASSEEYLLARRLASRRGAGVVLRQGAALLFAAKPWFIDHPNAGIRLFRVAGTERFTGADHNVQELPTIEGALPKVVSRAYEVLDGLIQKSSKLHDLFFREVPEYPTFAWQEAIINAVAHRDYRTRGRCVEVWLFDDRLEVMSPGCLPTAVTLEALRSRRRIHVARNPMITRVLRDLGLMLGRGEGIPRMFSEMERSWLRLPEMAADEYTFTLTLRNRPIFEAGDPAWIRHLESLPLQDRQRRVLAAYRRGTFTNRDYQSLNDVDRDTAYREIKELVERGLVLAKEGEGRASGYQVVRDIPAFQAPSLSPERRRWVLIRITQVGAFQKGDYMAALRLDRGTATSDLDSLVASDILCREGRGRGTRYVQGMKWNEWKNDAQ